MKKLLFLIVTVTCSLMIAQSNVFPQASFPTRPVTVWVGFAAGGATDTVIRTLAEGAGKSLGQRVVVMNKPGGGQTVAVSLLTKEKPDGYTIAGVTDVPLTRAPHLMDVDYDPFQDLSFVIGGLGAWKSLFVAKADGPFKKWEDVVDWAKKNPGQLTYGHPGIGTTPHIAMVKVAKKAGFTFKDVPFAGDTPLLSAFLGGHVMIGGIGTVAVRSHVDAKTVRILLSIEKELEYAPEVPTFDKVHYDFGIIPASIIICAPKGIPDLTKHILQKAFSDGMKTETFAKIAKDQELILTGPLTGKDLFDQIKKSYALYGEFIKEAGVYKIEKK